MTIQVSDTAVPSNSSQITPPIGFDLGIIQNFQNWIDQAKSTLVPAITETKIPTSTAIPTPPSTPTPAPSSPPWNPITTFTSWLQQNQQTILTIIAFILIAIAGLIFILDRFRGELGKAISILLGAIAAGYLAWVYVIYPVFVWLTQNWIAVTIIIAALIAIVIVAWKKGWIGKPISPDNGGGYVPPETSAEDTPFDQFEEFIYGKNGYEFEEYIRKLFSDMNYKGVNVTPQSKDGGVDVRAYKIDESETRIDYIIQCKRWEKNSVGRPKLQEFWGIMTDKPPHPKGIFICTRGFSKDAEEYAKLKGITYWNMERLFEFHQKYYR